MTSKPPITKDADARSYADLGSACVFLEQPEHRTAWSTPARTNGRRARRSWFAVIWGAERNTVVYAPDIGALLIELARELGWKP